MWAQVGQSMVSERTRRSKEGMHSPQKRCSHSFWAKVGRGSAHKWQGGGEFLVDFGFRTGVVRRDAFGVQDPSTGPSPWFNKAKRACSCLDKYKLPELSASLIHSTLVAQVTFRTITVTSPFTSRFRGMAMSALSSAWIHVRWVGWFSFYNGLRGTIVRLGQTRLLYHQEWMH